uniref:Uncharacterized protein n=1 Tax=Arundo donax TaxID=35708 RepID=A0A0A9B1V8_ARUDO
MSRLSLEKYSFYNMSSSTHDQSSPRWQLTPLVIDTPPSGALNTHI